MIFTVAILERLVGLGATAQVLAVLECLVVLLCGMQVYRLICHELKKC